MKSFLLIPNLTREKTEGLLAETKEILERLGAEYDVRPDGSFDKDRSCDGVIFIGGDGTMLRSAHTALELGVPMVGINAGSLGYYSRIKEDELEEKLPRLMRDEYSLEECALLTADGKRAIVNDLVAMAKGSIATFIVIRQEGREIYRTVSSGIIVSTTIGSTGINRSAGGAVLQNGAEILEITPVLPNRGEKNPLVLSVGDGIELSWNAPAEVKCDGEVSGSGESGIRLTLFDKKLRLVCF